MKLERVAQLRGVKLTPEVQPRDHGLTRQQETIEQEHA